MPKSRVMAIALGNTAQCQQTGGRALVPESVGRSARSGLLLGNFLNFIPMDSAIGRSTAVNPGMELLLSIGASGALHGVLPDFQGPSPDQPSTPHANAGQG